MKTPTLIVLFSILLFACSQPNPLPPPSPRPKPNPRPPPGRHLRPSWNIPASRRIRPRQSVSYAHYRHFFLDALFGLLILLVILRWRVAPAIRNLAERVSANRFVQLIIFAPLTLLAISIPDHRHRHQRPAPRPRLRRLRSRWPAWIADWITNEIIFLIVGTVLVAILYAVIRRSPRRWWFYFWLASIPVVLSGFFAQPLVVDPLFFKFTPLVATEPVLVADMQKVMHHGGIDIPSERMFLMNASSKTTQLNAYVTGFGQSKRVVIWDNTINKAGIQGTLFVFGHEMGHYVLLHIPKEMAIIVADRDSVLSRLSSRELDASPLGNQWAIRDLQDRASLPVLLRDYLCCVSSHARLQRRQPLLRAQADRYGLEVIHGSSTTPTR